MNRDEQPLEAPTDPDVVAYDDDGAVVLCERTNPNAWIRSSLTVPVEEYAANPPEASRSG